MEARELSNISLGLINTLVDEQRLLLLADNNELSLEINSFSTKDILLEIKCLYESHDKAEGKTININDTAVQMMMSSD